MSVLRSSLIMVVMFLATEEARGQAFPQLIPPIDDLDLDRIAEILEMSEAQELFMLAQRNEYVSIRATMHSPQIERYTIARSHANKVYGREVQGDLSDSFDEAYRIAEQLNGQLLALDEEFYEAIVPILTEHQIERLPRARNARLRRLYRIGDGALPEVKVDIVNLITALSEAEEHELEKSREMTAQPVEARPTLQLSANETIGIEHVIETFEPQIIAARKNYRSLQRQGRTDSFERMDIGRWLKENGLTESDRPELAERRAHLLEQATKKLEAPSKRLVALNRQFISALRTELPKEKGAELERLYLETAYPDVYPDAATADNLYEKVLAWDQLSEEQLDAIKVRHAEFRLEHARLSEEMAESIARRRSTWLWADNPVLLAEEWARLRDIGQRRIKLNRTQAARIAEFLTPEQVAQMPNWKYADSEPPRPWDPRYRAPRDSSDGSSL